MNSGGNLHISNPICKDYVLDKTKAIQRKNDACAKPHIESTMKSGNNLVLEFSIAAYEYARQCLITILNSSTQYVGMVRHSEETSGAKVDTCIKVYNRKSDSSQGKNLKFVVNLYHTSSTMVVNGSRVDLYVADIHKLLCDELSKKGHMFTSLNDNITCTISKLTSTVPNLNQNLAATNINCQNNLDDLAISFRTEESIDLNEDTGDICPICNKISLLETVECSECFLWIHYECAGLSQSAVSALSSLDFVCALCTDNMLYEVHTIGCNNSQNLHPEMNSLVVNDTSPDTYVRPPTPTTTLPEGVTNSVMDASDETTLVKEIYNQHDTSVLANNAKNNHSQQSSNQSYGATPKRFPNSEPSLSDNIQKKPKRQNIRTMKPKINNAEDKAYIIKLENEINKQNPNCKIHS
ncbi:unnamed protein product [Mytilus coruscus]|uniref:Zinc finger PHD-type domain-containing protein n=1 Tax=Mytilus coruscus TaxID=42192 RepID=A0A6J8CHZ8_MYTCO|nr:unnamed protein product [Mytilus coruscus]